jgi:drug/metabolite transporter (DMT)-like permease
VTTSHGERVAVTAFVTYTVLAGGNAVGIRFSNRELAPLWGASLRVALAAGLFLAVMVVLRLAFPRGRPLLGSLLYGLFNIGAAFGLIYYGLVRVHAGLGQILLAFVPLATLLLAVLWRQEHLTVAAVIGTLLALAGVAVISRSPLQQNVPPGCNRLGGGVPAVLDRSPVLGGVAGVLRVRHHPVRHFGALSLARQRACRPWNGLGRAPSPGRRLRRSATCRQTQPSGSECEGLTRGS